VKSIFNNGRGKQAKQPHFQKIKVYTAFRTNDSWVVPVGLGLLWFPFMRRFSIRGIHAMLAFTVGLLFFLVIDTFQEGFEMAAEAPGVFQGSGLVWFGALLSFLFLIAMDQAHERNKKQILKKESVFLINWQQG
jgi:hypothetical protein